MDIPEIEKYFILLIMKKCMNQTRDLNKMKLLESVSDTIQYPNKSTSIYFIRLILWNKTYFSK